jgi:hypothetical protein
MHQSEIAKFKAMLQGVYSFWDKQVTDFQLDVWWAALQKYDYEPVADAFSRYVGAPDAASRFLPKPADIALLLDGSRVDNAALAWAKVEKAIARVGCYQTTVFDDAVIHAAIDRMGGWVKLCMVTNDELPFKRNEFLSQYRAIKSLPRFEHPPSLIGMQDLENVGKGYKAKAPVMIGNQAACMAVLKGGSDTSLQVTHAGQLAGQLVKMIGG